jgi:hypothetical protein
LVILIDPVNVVDVTQFGGVVMFPARKVASLSAHETAPTPKAQYTAVIHAADGVRFIATARRPDELAARVVNYILGRCDHTLWPSDARCVRQLIDERTPFAAIALYFSKIGGRWDVERLELGGLSFGPD